MVNPNHPIVLILSLLTIGNNMLNILTNGDSFTHEYHLPKESRWTNLLGVTCNIALGAGSNDRIFFTTVEYLNHNNPDVLIIGWTSWVRSFLYTTCGDRYVICGDSAFKEDIGIISNSNDISKIYYNNFFKEL